MHTPESEPWSRASLLELRLAAQRFLPAESVPTGPALRRLLKEAEAARGLSPGAFLTSIRQGEVDIEDDPPDTAEEIERRKQS